MTASLMVTVDSGDHQDSESLVIIPMEDDITIYKISGEGVIYSAGDSKERQLWPLPV